MMRLPDKICFLSTNETYASFYPARQAHAAMDITPDRS